MSEPQTDVGRWCRDAGGPDAWEHWERENTPITDRIEDIILRVRHDENAASEARFRDIEAVVEALETDSAPTDRPLSQRILSMVNRSRSALEDTVIRLATAEHVITRLKNGTGQ